MVLEFDPEAILHETDIVSVEASILRYAQELAVLGAMEPARALIALFYQRGTSDGDNHLLHRLAFAWHEIGLWPEGTPDELKSHSIIDRLRSSYDTCWGTVDFGVPENLRTWDEKCLDACLDFTCGVDPQKTIPKYHSEGIGPSERLVKALDISVRLSHGSEHSAAEVDLQHEESGVGCRGNQGVTAQSDGDSGWVKVASLDKRSSEILRRIVQRWDRSDQVLALTQAERLWPLFVTGVVADAAGLSRTELDVKANTILDTLTRRLHALYAHTALAGKTMKQLLDIGNEYTTRGAAAAIWFHETYDLDDDHDDRPQTLFREPASDVAVAELEQRLGCVLPKDYKEFLQISNGFFYGHEEYPDGMFDGYGAGAPIYNAERVHWEDDEWWHLPFELLPIPREIEQLGDVEQKGDWKTAMPIIDRVLAIGDRDSRHLWLISPDLVAQARKAYYTMHARANEKQKAVIEGAMVAFAGSKEAFDSLEWVCTSCAVGGDIEMTNHPSFARYLEIAAVESMEDHMGSSEPDSEAESGI